MNVYNATQVFENLTFILTCISIFRMNDLVCKCCHILVTVCSIHVNVLYTFLGSYTKSLDSFLIKKIFVMAFITILIKSTNLFFINVVFFFFSPTSHVKCSKAVND